MDGTPWETLAESVQGVNKQRNQDWCVATGAASAADPLILAVADGHGSAAHPRSDYGARVAVDLFVSEAEGFARLARTHAAEDARRLSWLMHYARQSLPRQLVGFWRQRIFQHWSDHREEVEQEPANDRKALLYGTTLLGAVLTPQLFVAWQLGDGELTVVGDGGAPVLPLAPDEAELGDETESLCSRDAWRLVRVHWEPITNAARMPRFIALSTDGLSKSFASDEGFLAFMAGLERRLADKGIDDVQAVLPEWLGKAARHSGDDTTLAAGRPGHQGTDGRGSQP